MGQVHTEANQEGEQLPPYNLQAEEAVLGSCLISTDDAVNQIPWLKPEHFFRDKNQWVFGAIRELAGRGIPCNQVTVAAEVAQKGLLEPIGGSDYLDYLVMEVPTSVHIVHYANIVYRLAGYRGIVNAGEEIQRVGYGAGVDLHTSISKAEESIEQVRLQYPQKSDRVLSHKESLSKFYDEQGQMAELLSNGGSWLTTPWGEYNTTVRLRPGSVTIIAGPSSHGKTTMANNIADYAAGVLGMKGVYFFNELNNYQIQGARACRFITVVDPNTMYRLAPKIRDIEDGKYCGHPDMMQHLNNVYNWPGEITHVNALNWSVYQIGSEIKEQALKGNADFVIVDYAQMIPRDNVSHRDVNDARALGIIITHLKQVCAGLPKQPPIIILSQVSRGIKTEDDCTLDKLRDSGEIGEYSNVATIIYNRWHSTKGKCIENCKLDRGTTNQGECHLRCLTAVTVKNTFGPTGSDRLRFIPWRFKIVDDDGTDWTRQVPTV